MKLKDVNWPMIALAACFIVAVIMWGMGIYHCVVCK